MSNVWISSLIPSFIVLLLVIACVAFFIVRYKGIFCQSVQ